MVGFQADSRCLSRSVVCPTATQRNDLYHNARICKPSSNIGIPISSDHLAGIAGYILAGTSRTLTLRTDSGLSTGNARWHWQSAPTLLLEHHCPLIDSLRPWRRHGTTKIHCAGNCRSGKRSSCTNRGICQKGRLTPKRCLVDHSRAFAVTTSSHVYHRPQQCFDGMASIIIHDARDSNSIIGAKKDRHMVRPDQPPPYGARCAEVRSSSQHHGITALDHLLCFQVLNDLPTYSKLWLLQRRCVTSLAPGEVTTSPKRGKYT